MSHEKLPSALEVARFLIALAARDPEYTPKALTPKQLQKILYYVQGWSLGRRDRPVFKDELRAWREGPVVQAVYNEYRDLGNRGIPADVEEPDLPPLIKAFVASVWDDYRWYTERELIDKSHRERPWVAARNGYKDHEPSDELMAHGELRDFFSQPSVAALTAEELKLIASRPENAPPQSWYEEGAQATE